MTVKTVTKLNKPKSKVKSSDVNARLRALRSIRGMWKHKDIDPVQYQREARDEE